MTDNKKYDKIVSDIFDTFMKELEQKLKEPISDGDLANEKEYKEEEFDDELEEDDFEDKVLKKLGSKFSKEEESNPFESLEQLIDQVISDVIKESKDNPRENS